MNVLVTGGTGYIGSHTCVELINNNYNVIVLDNLSNSSETVLDKIKEITGIKPKFYFGDIRNQEIYDQIFNENKIDAVIHFAGLKSVNESINIPLEYYSNNVEGSLILLKKLDEYKIEKLVFSSSSSVYGADFEPPLKESLGFGNPLNPYARTKMIIEMMIKDYSEKNKNFSGLSLRYFNPIGAHETGLIGENPNGIPNNLVPYIAEVAIGKRDHLRVWGSDYNTPDGTCIRDFIHVVDLAKAHVKALEWTNKNKGYETINIGTGSGYSVLEVLHAYEKACSHKIPFSLEKRREGDVPICFADTSKAEQILNFKTSYDINKMCKDSYNYITKKTE